jgi:hypothetical protein
MKREPERCMPFVEAAAARVQVPAAAGQAVAAFAYAVDGLEREDQQKFLRGDANRGIRLSLPGGAVGD